MLQIGKYQSLKIDRQTSVGFYLIDQETNEDVLLPRKYITDSMNTGDEIEVFVYSDSMDRPVATTENPLITAGQFSWLTCEAINQFGAFMNMGLIEKQLMIPYRNQARRLEPGKNYMVYCYLDEESERLVGSTKVNKFLSTELPPEYKEDTEVKILVRGESDLGMNVIVDQKYHGLIYYDDMVSDLKPGQTLNAFIKNIREDNKLDLSLHPIGVKAIEPAAQTILQALTDNNGFLPFNDKSDPDDIRNEFGMSKKLFKKSVGSLYKQRLIRIENKGIYIK